MLFGKVARRGISRILDQGEGFTYRVYLSDAKDKKLSPWHDLPLKEAGQEIDHFTAFYEIPRGTLPKMEVATKEQFNPVKQDVKKNK